MKRSVVIALVIAAAAAVWILSGQFGASDPAQPDARTSQLQAADEKPLEVRTQLFSSRDFHARTIVTGRTESARRVELKAQTAGQIEEIGATEGTAVSKGKLIARIAMRDRGARLAEAEALLAQRRSELSAARKLAQKGYRAATRLAADQAAHDQALARLKQIQIEITETRLQAPFDGVLEDRAVEIGDYVAVGDPIATIVDLDPILIVASVTERDVSGITVGSTGRARLVTGEEVEGTVRYIASVADAGTRTFRIELQVANQDGGIRAGLTAELVLPGRTVAAHLIPSSVLTLSDAGVVGVKSVDEAGIVHFGPVQILADDPDGSWVAGLPDAIELIVVGQEFTTEGEKVIAQRMAGETS